MISLEHSGTMRLNHSPFQIDLRQGTFPIGSHACLKRLKTGPNRCPVRFGTIRFLMAPDTLEPNDGADEITPPQPLVPDNVGPARRRIADQPHPYTLWLACAAVAVSVLSALFSGFQFWESHVERQKPSVLRVRERPRLAFESSGEAKVLVPGSGIVIDAQGARSLPPKETVSVGVTLTFRNVGRTMAIIKACEYNGILMAPKSASEPVATPLAPPGTARQTCDLRKKGGTFPAVTVAPNEMVEMLVVTQDMPQHVFDQVRRNGLIQAILGGNISYEDPFHDVLATSWFGTVLLLPGSPASRFEILSVAFKP
jgi:hypothetical protein